MAVIFKKSEDYNEWNFNFCKITPESGEKNTKDNYDWSTSYYLD